MKKRYIETELGVERLCKHCDEYYPLDDEFWYLLGNTLKNGLPAVTPACKGCYHDTYKPHRRSKNKMVQIKSSYEWLFGGAA